MTIKLLLNSVLGAIICALLSATASLAQGEIDKIQFGIGYAYAPGSLRLAEKLPLFDNAGPDIIPSNLGSECFEGAGVTAVKKANGSYEDEVTSIEDVSNSLMIFATQRAKAILVCGSAEYAVALKIEVRDNGEWKLYNGDSDNLLNQFALIMARYRFAITSYEVYNLDGGGVLIHDSEQNQFAFAVRNGRIKVGVGPVSENDIDYMTEIIERRGHEFELRPYGEEQLFFDIALSEVNHDQFVRQLADDFWESLGLIMARLGIGVETKGWAVGIQSSSNWLDKVYRESFE